MSAGVTVREFTDSHSNHLLATGSLSFPRQEQQTQIEAVAYIVLHLPDPIGVRDYVASGGDIKARVFTEHGEPSIQLSYPQGAEWIETLDWDELCEARAMLEEEGDDVVPDSAEMLKLVKDRMSRMR